MRYLFRGTCSWLQEGWGKVSQGDVKVMVMLGLDYGY